MKFNKRTHHLKTIGIILLLFVAIYLPTFLLISLLHPKPNHVVPLVIGISFIITLCFIFFIQTRFDFSFVDFGFTELQPKIFASTFILSFPIALAITWVLQFANEKNPLQDVSFKPWEMFVYFGIGAAIQEETIFRGLLQAVLFKRLKNGMLSMILISFLFALIHLSVGFFTALSALMLSLFAGYSRIKSKSIWSAVLVHSIFNVCGIIWLNV
jgi:membrane protease YdiL (CAAX protease family)